MIRSFQHKGLERFFNSGSKAGIQPTRATKLRLQLTALDHAKQPEDMNVPGWRFHRLTGKFAGYFSVSGNWRLIFKFEGRDAESVDYLDYH